ncbi:unnamed protein product [Brachionus calyciflorus]|uniref:Uncharacterized protein n=1 Tax=Brachionus calyciflorus TaxID=104777 RepID=A0A813MAX8_9BILA|nr:unnamed protein product [Brachionus calyciflorus]
MEPKILKLLLIIMISQVELCPFKDCELYDNPGDTRPICVCGQGIDEFKFQLNNKSPKRKLSILKIYNFKQIPKNSFRGLHVEKLILSNSPIRVIKTGIFQKFKYLLKMELSNMPFLFRIESNPLRFLARKLNELKLNNLRSLRTLNFRLFSKLIALDIGSSSINNLILSEANKLELVRVEKSTIRNLSIFNLPLVSDFYLQNSSLDSFLISNLTSLNYLSIESNKFKTQPKFSNLKKLKSLILDKNNLDDSILTYLINFNDLENLSLIDNRIRRVDFLQNLKKLKNLVLDSNLIDGDLNFENGMLISILLSNNLIKNLKITNMSNLIDLKFGKNLLENFQISSCPKLNSLVFQDFKLKSLNIDNLSSLTYLRLNNTSWETLQIQNVSSLKFLSTFKTPLLNYLDNLKVPNLQDLTLSGNNLSLISIQVLNRFKNIFGMDFNDNNLGLLGNASFILKEKFLVLSKNKLSFDNDLKSIILNNYYVDLSFNLIGSLDLQGNDSVVEDLVLNDNKIINCKFENFQQLNSLELMRNGMVYFKAQNIPKIRVLNLSFNKLENDNFEISQDISTNLKELYLNSNNFTYLNFEFFQNLIQLNLDQNKLSNFDFSSKILKSLKIASNKLSSLNFLVNLPNLENLDVSGNLIRSLEPSIFMNNKNLKSINLARNYLPVIPSLDNLVYLDLLNLSNQNDRLKMIPNYAFSNSLFANNNILKIDLTGNKIESFGKKILCGLNRTDVIVSSLEMDCDLNVDKCFYQNLSPILTNCKIDKFSNDCFKKSDFILQQVFDKFSLCPNE